MKAGQRAKVGNKKGNPAYRTQALFRVNRRNKKNTPSH